MGACCQLGPAVAEISPAFAKAANTVSATIKKKDPFDDILFNLHSMQNPVEV